MPSLLGRTLAQTTLNMHRAVGKLYSGTLRVRGAADAMTSVAWGNYYLEPIAEQTALGGGGVQPLTATLHLYQTSETTTPRPDDLFWENGGSSDTTAWLITSNMSTSEGFISWSLFFCVTPSVANR